MATCSQAGKSAHAATAKPQPCHSPSLLGVACVCSLTRTESLRLLIYIYPSFQLIVILKIILRESWGREPERGEGEGGRGQGKTEISLKRDQWSSEERRLIELGGGGGDKSRGDMKGEAEGGALRRSFCVPLGQIREPPARNAFCCPTPPEQLQVCTGVLQVCVNPRTPLDAPVHPSHGCSPDYPHYCSITGLSSPICVCVCSLELLGSGLLIDCCATFALSISFSVNQLKWHISKTAASYLLEIWL